MSYDIAVTVNRLGKVFHTYHNPRDRLVQALLSFASRLMPGRSLKSYLQKKATERRRDFHALSDVTFEVKKGQTVGIIGRNGSGKSTLLQIICGTLSPTTGRADFSGKVAALLELGSGFNPEFSGRDNVYLSGQLYGLSKRQIDERYEDIVGFADIGEFVNQPVKTYSSGMMVRLAFSVIVHVDAEILIIDEALAVGDAFFTQKCMRFLRKFMETGTILFVSHDTASVKSLCSHVIWLDGGAVVQQGDPKEVCDQYLNAFFESQHGKVERKKQFSLSKKTDARDEVKYDQRLQYLNNSNLRNDLQIFKFDEDAAHYGKQDAVIDNVYFVEESGDRLNWAVGGELVALVINCSARRSILSPIIGFYIKDRLGQTLFGDNTYLEYAEAPVDIPAGVKFEGSFKFRMPVLPAGDYSVCVSLAEGTQLEHSQLHWIYDALSFRSESSSISTGLVGIPILDITIKVVQ